MMLADGTYKEPAGATALRLLGITAGAIAFGGAATGAQSRGLDALALAGTLFGAGVLLRARILLHRVSSAPELDPDLLSDAKRSVTSGGIAVVAGSLALFTTVFGGERR